MDNIVIDAPTGDVVVKTMIKHIMPGMHDSSVLKAVRRILKDYTGPKMSSRLIQGRNMSVASIGLCYDILDKMTGHKWTTWRQQSGQAFKQALHERVQQARSPVQMHETPPLQQQVATQVAQVETKASVLQKALRSVNIDGSVRIHELTAEASLIDVVSMLCPEKTTDYAKTTLSRVIAKDHGEQTVGEHFVPLAERVHYIKINGKGHETPVSDAKTIVEIIWLLPARAAKEFRRQSAETICRVLGGDVSLCDEIEQRCVRLQSTEEGRAYQNFVLDQQPAKKHRCEPFWFEHGTDEEKRAYISTEAMRSIALTKKDTVLAEIDIHDVCRDKLQSAGQFAARDEIEYGDRIKDVQRRASRSDNMLAAAPADNATISVARPVDDSIDPETGLLIATPKCSESVRGPETSICLEAGKMGIKVGEKAGQVGKVVKGLYSERYGDEAGHNIPKRNTTFRGKPFPENSYWARDADLIQQAIQIVCVPAAKPRQLTTQTLLFAAK